MCCWSLSFEASNHIEPLFVINAIIAARIHSVIPRSPVSKPPRGVFLVLRNGFKPAFLHLSELRKTPKKYNPSNHIEPNSLKLRFFGKMVRDRKLNVCCKPCGS